MMKTMTIGAAARWAGVSPRMLGLFLTGRLVDSLSEIDVDCDGLNPFLVASMPGSGAEDAPRTFPRLVEPAQRQMATRRAERRNGAQCRPPQL